MILGSGTATNALTHRFRREDGFPYWTLGCNHDGAVALSADGAERLIPERSLVLIAERTPYAIRFGGGRRWRETWIIFTPPSYWRDLLEWPTLLPGVMTLGATDGQGAEALAQFVEAQRLLAGTLPNRARLAANALEHGLLLAQLAHPDAGESALHPAVRTARDLLAGAPAEPVTVAALARRVRLSPSHLAHLFTAQVGDTPMRYLERCRIDRAKQLLLGTGHPIADIAADCGFADPFHFSTRFRRLVGMAPRRFRRGQPG